MSIVPFANKAADLLNCLQAKNKKPFVLTGYAEGDPTKKLLSPAWLNWIPSLIPDESYYGRHHNWMI